MNNFFYGHCRALLFALGEFIRNPFASSLTILVIGIAMALPTILFILLLNAKILGQSWNQDPNITLYLKQTTSESEATVLLQSLKSNRAIASIQYVSPEQGLREFSKAIQIENLLAKLGKNPLPPVLIITPTKDYLNPESLNSLASTLQKLPQVDSAEWDITWVKRFYLILSLIERLGGFLAIALGAAVLLIIGNTIRLTTQTHRQEISLLKLMGASQAFIRRPLLYRGLLYGVFGGMLAWLLVFLLFYSIKPFLLTLFSTYSLNFSLKGFNYQMALIVIGGCGILGFLGAWCAAERHILSDDSI
jgi:cell division transport system permease protein